MTTKAGNLAALVAYYGFFSLFPLMLVLVTVLGIVLQGNIELQGIPSSRSRFPVIGEGISSNVPRCEGAGSCSGSGFALSLWSRDSAS